MRRLLAHRALLLVTALALLAAACGGTDQQAGIAETDAGASAEGNGGGETGGGQNNAGQAATDSTTTTVATGADPAAVTVSADGGTDFKQEEAETIASLNSANEPVGLELADVAPAVFGQPNDGEIEETFDIDRWTFEGQAGQLIAIDVLAIDHDCRQDLVLNLEGPDGERGKVDWIGNGGCRVHGPLELEQTGTHVIEFAGGDGAVIEDQTGAYRFVPVNLVERDVAAVIFDQPNDGEISEPLGVDRWTFDAAEGDILTIDVLDIEHDCRQDLTLVLEDPIGEREQLDWVGNGGCGGHGPHELEQAGTYTIEFHGGRGGIIADNTGTYRFVPNFLTETDQAPGVTGTRLEGEIVQLFGSDRWTFDAVEGDILAIDMLDIDHDCRQDLNLILEDPFGERERLDWVGNGGCRGHGPYELEQTGTYIIEFQGGSGGIIEHAVGSYAFSFTIN